jgi:hypothetical protein
VPEFRRRPYHHGIFLRVFRGSSKLMRVSGAFRSAALSLGAESASAVSRKLFGFCDRDRRFGLAQICRGRTARVADQRAPRRMETRVSARFCDASPFGGHRFPSRGHCRQRRNGLEVAHGSVLAACQLAFHLVVILPTNKLLSEIKPLDAGPQSRELIEKSGKLHAVRSLLGIGATVLFLWASLG